MEEKISDLTYNIPEAHLYGVVNSKKIDVRAYSGGRAGTKTKDAENIFLANNPFKTRHKLNEKLKGDSGGALPMGYYTLKPHENKKNWIRLIPSNNNNMAERDGFAIHGRGKRGSDGCIVPKDFKIVTDLYDYTLNLQKEHMNPLILKVIAMGNLDHYERLNRIV